MEPQSDSIDIEKLIAWLEILKVQPDSRVGRLFSPPQLDLLESGMLEVIGHGNGTVEIHIRDRRLTGINVIKRNKA